MIEFYSKNNNGKINTSESVEFIKYSSQEIWYHYILS